ncbi:MAG: hypothetical protein ERJ67_08085 [Aphanocapsa feldmannii 277cV]|uniref:Uncharacterized protein n=1 Tax=Aphanocapsa feldmannii 277cV TaxID=2507553 RepID=A0A524RM89_9CHRO|nr:MAG: hypothetical protein ERJ69_02215 [Aphanocapsa feldmannii 288cV]TGG91428.1 MAG: hypothetical protein ERJ67_08085 [Aphanocapsa feldmannii 277cV]
MSSKASPGFEQAMDCAAAWLRAWVDEEISDEVLADRVAELVASRDGARGFFVVALAGDAPLMDRLPDVLVFCLREAGADVVDLSVRNLAMSTAMALDHQRKGDQQQAEGSLRVRRRCLDLLRVLQPGLVKQRLEQLLDGLGDRGEDIRFLARWGYDAEQKQAIEAAVLAVVETGH